MGVCSDHADLGFSSRLLTHFPRRPAGGQGHSGSATSADSRLKTGVHSTTQQDFAAHHAEVVAFVNIFIKGFDHMPTLSKNCKVKKEFRLPYTNTPEGWDLIYEFYTSYITLKETAPAVLSLRKFKAAWRRHFPHVHFSRTKNGFSECQICFAYKQAVMFGALSASAAKKWDAYFKDHLQHTFDCRVRCGPRGPSLMGITCALTRPLHRLAADEEKSKPNYDPRDLTEIVGPGRLKEVARLSFTSNPGRATGDSWAITADGAGSDALSNIPSSGKRSAKVLSLSFASCLIWLSRTCLKGSSSKLWAVLWPLAACFSSRFPTPRNMVET